MNLAEWEDRAARLWTSIGDLEPAAFVEAMRALAADCPDQGLAAFNIGGAHDSTGQPDAAIGYYERALAAGLDSSRRRQATIQLASSLRETGRADRALALIEAEAEVTGDEWDSAVAMCRALTLAELGRDREGLAVALVALAPHLPRYQASTVNYARRLVGWDPR